TYAKATAGKPTTDLPTYAKATAGKPTTDLPTYRLPGLPTTDLPTTALPTYRNFSDIYIMLRHFAFIFFLYLLFGCSHSSKKNNLTVSGLQQVVEVIR